MQPSRVLIVGAGPVGLTLAMALAQRGITVTVVETRHAGEPPEVKCNHVSSRSMEIFRRLGVAQAVRDAGLPDDYPNDVAYRTTFTGMELSRINIPNRRQRFTATGGADTWWPTPEPPHRINQIYLEPILFEHAKRTPGLRLVNRVQVNGFEQDEQGVTVFARGLDTSERLQFRCEYLLGCDGGRSTIRKALGAKLLGVDVVGRVQSTFIRAPDLLLRSSQQTGNQPAWANFSLNPRRCGMVYAIDGKELWLIHNYLLAHETDFAAVDRDWAIREILGVGKDFRYEIISREDWTGRRLVADRFRKRRAFICGDAAHLWIPMAGYGMNAGIADAENLAWLLAAHLQGWADEGILNAYEAERQPITEQVSTFAMNHALALQAQREAVPLQIEDDSPAGAQTRAVAGKALYELNVKQYCCGGLNYGYFYDRSPLIAYDGQAAPPYTMSEFVQSTVPGCRTPHVWLKDDSSNKVSLYDRMGSGHTLIRLDAALDISPLTQAAHRASLPLDVLDVNAADIIPASDRAVFDHKLLLSRPDFHLAWRGNRLPDDCAALVQRLRGGGDGTCANAPASA